MNAMLHYKKSQQGAALIVGLVLLLVLTILAISTMSTSRLEVTMAGNNQYAENAFQLAETGNAVVFQQINAGQIFPIPDADLPQTAQINVPDLGGAYQTQVTWAGNAGFTDEYGTDFCQYVWINSSIGTSSRQARTVHRQGFWIVGDPDGCAGL